MWVFVGELVICFITGPDSLQGVRVQACSRHAERRAFLGTALRLQDHAEAPRGLAEVADADKVRKFVVDSKSCVSACPQKVLVLQLVAPDCPRPVELSADLQLAQHELDICDMFFFLVINL